VQEHEGYGMLKVVPVQNLLPVFKIVKGLYLLQPPSLFKFLPTAVRSGLTSFRQHDAAAKQHAFMSLFKLHVYARAKHTAVNYLLKPTQG
jgi:hypothetical protein